MLRAVERLTCISQEMTAFFTCKEVLERLEGDECEVHLEEDSADFNKVGICGYMAKGDNNLSLAVLCSEGCLNAGKKIT